MKYHLDELVSIEEDKKLWNIKYRSVPVWHFLRETQLSSTKMVPFPKKMPDILSVLKSFFCLFRLRLRGIKRVYFFLHRKDLLDFYNFNENLVSDEFCEIFVHQESRVKNNEYNSCDSLNVIRYLMRKLAYLFCFKEYYSLCNQLQKNLNCKSEVKSAVRVTIGDYWTLRILKMFIPAQAKVYYAGVGVPGIEKYLNLLSSSEVQHGVIHTIHPGYSNIPKTKNILIIYSKLYFRILEQCVFQGRVRFAPFKTNLSKVKIDTKYPFVIYTQPLDELSNFINDNILKHNKGNIFLQRHPRDDFPYEIDKKYIVNNIHPKEVKCGVVFNSSVIEDLALNEVPIILLDFKFNGIDLSPYFDVYQPLLENGCKNIKCSSVSELQRELLRFV